MKKTAALIPPCSKCSENSPRGLDTKTGRCWTCVFPRP